MGKIKILELCHFSQGICGVWNRVKEESVRLSDLGYEVCVFSSNAIKGSQDIAKPTDEVDGVKIKRFPYVKLGGESFMNWNFINEGIDYAPDVIIAHVYRHIHTTRALKLKKELAKAGKDCKVLLVTHAPFNEDNSERGLLSSIAVKLYDWTLGRNTINNFDKVIAISNWELPYLSKIGLENKRTVYLPNGIPPSFFKSNPKKGENNKILFLGRVSPIKNLELVISALNKLDKKYFVEIVGPSEGGYKRNLLDLAKKECVADRVIFSKPIYDIDEKISKMDSAAFFILPSKREGMPQSMVEAMARGRVCIGSDVEGISDLIKEGINGFTFKKNDLNSLITVLNHALNLPASNIKSIGKSSISFASKFNWNNIISKLDKLIKVELHTRR